MFGQCVLLVANIHISRSFSRRIPKALSHFATKCENIVDSFHKDVESRTSSTASYSELFQTLASQLHTYHSSFQQVALSAKQIVNSRQREANREFIPSIAQSLHLTYNTCGQAKGKWPFRLMARLLICLIGRQGRISVYEGCCVSRCG